MAINIRALAAKCSYAVIDQGRSLGEELPKQLAKVDGKDKGLLQEICFGVLRYLPELEYDVQQLVDKPLTGKQRVFHFLMIVGVYQLKYTRIPDHAAVSETVAATATLKSKHLKGFVNGVLRNYQRKVSSNSELTATNVADAITYNHPGWFIKRIKAGYPSQWQSILAANQERPPMWLRVNQQHHSVAEYLALLAQADIAVTWVDEKSGAIKLENPMDVMQLPGFEDGWVSIQDGAAQQAATLLNCQPNDIVLDCCAAPGGKTCHMLELTPTIKQMTAIDIDENRLVRVRENLARLSLNAQVLCGDASDSSSWWDGQQYDKILLDAPCSGTGVIRRHPDIKWLRKNSDIDNLTELQSLILKNIWSLLKPGGTLLYATCSILPEENKAQVEQFIKTNDDAQLESITADPNQVGWQILPNEHGMDGFYYAKLVKKES